MVVSLVILCCDFDCWSEVVMNFMAEVKPVWVWSVSGFVVMEGEHGSLVWCGF
jgi:hypothetical protein